MTSPWRVHAARAARSNAPRRRPTSSAPSISSVAPARSHASLPLLSPFATAHGDTLRVDLRAPLAAYRKAKKRVLLYHPWAAPPWSEAPDVLEIELPGTDTAALLAPSRSR